MAKGTPPWRPQPPEIQTPQQNISTPWEPGDEREMPGVNQTPSNQYGDGGDGSGEVPQLKKDDYVKDDEQPAPKRERPEQPDWIKRARDAYQFSTTYIDSNYRKSWED